MSSSPRLHSTSLDSRLQTVEKVVIDQLRLGPAGRDPDQALVPGAVGVSAGQYQLLPPLSEEEYLALKADVAKRGVLVPVEVDENGAILDGHHRLRIARELGIEAPTIVRSGWSEQEKREHVLKVNLLRRQLGPIAWAEAFRQFAKGRGVSLGQGKRNDRTSATVAEVAAELGVAARTARQRLQVADQLRDVPDLAALVDAGQLPAKRALRVKRDAEAKQQREEGAARRAAEAAGKPVAETRWRAWYEVEEWDPDELVPILTDDELALAPFGHRWQVAHADPSQHANYATRPMSWLGDELRLPTGSWKVAVVRFAGTTEDVIRRWWSWDDYNGRTIRMAADPALAYTYKLRTKEFLQKERGPGSAWRRSAELLGALEADAAALRARLEAPPIDLDDPWAVWRLAEQVVSDYAWDRGSVWRRFSSWLLEQSELPLRGQT